MLKVLCLAVTVHVSLASICCIPRQWEGIEAQMIGIVKTTEETPSVSQTEIKVYFDAVNKRNAFDETVTANGFTTKVKVIQLWSVKMEYIIQESGKCVKKILAGSYPDGCIPDTAKDIGKHFEGSGSRKLDFHTYELTEKGFYIKVDLTPECEPITQEMYGKLPNGGYMMLTNRYYDIVHGINDTSVFNVPSSCDHAPIVGHGGTSHKVLGR